MNNPEKLVQKAFNELQPPADLNERTLAHILAFQNAGRPEGENASDATHERVTNETRNTPCAEAKLSRKQRKRIRVLRYAGIAAAACFLVAAVGVFAAFNRTTAYVDIDINPSLELQINRFGTVLSAEGINDDGKTLLDSLSEQGVSLTGTDYGTSLERLTTSGALDPYVSETSFAQFSVVCSNEQQAASLQSASEDCFAALPCAARCSRASSKDHTAAQNANMGVGRYLAACRLIEEDPAYTLDRCSGMTMREIHDALEKHGISPDEHSAVGQHAGSHASHLSEQKHLRKGREQQE